MCVSACKEIVSMGLTSRFPFQGTHGYVLNGVKVYLN